MNKCLLIFNCSILLLFFAGCSQIQYVTGVDLLNSSNGWQHNINDSRTNNLVYKDSTISFSFYIFSYPPVEGYDQRIITFGPPLIPIVPNPFAILGIGQSKYVEIGIDLLMNPDSNAVKFENIHLLLEDGIKLFPKIYKTHYMIIDSGRSTKNWHAFLRFDLPRDNVERFQIVFGNIIRNNESIIVSPLNYKRWWNYHYVPWVHIPWDH
jgi:hypothetical protein